MSQRLEREQLVLEQSLIRFNEVATTTREPRIILWLWILEYHTPREAWTQLANASFSALTGRDRFPSTIHLQSQIRYMRQPWQRLQQQ